MAITYKYGMNAALPYNTANNMEAYAVTIANTNAYFLSDAPLTRRLHISERSALYFLCINVELDLYVEYQSFDAAGNELQTINVDLTGKLSLYNAIPVNSSFVHPNAAKLLVRIIDNGDNVKTEQRIFIIDRTPYCLIEQLVWMNKLGGYDSYVFEAAKTINSNIKTENPFVSSDTNFFAPTRINSFLSKEITYGKKISTTANSLDEALWLQSSVNESIDVYRIEDDFYIPINVKSSGYTFETFQRELIVSIDYLNAFKTNIQTR